MCVACSYPSSFFFGSPDEANRDQVQSWVSESLLCCRTHPPARLPVFVWQHIDLCKHCYRPRSGHANNTKCLSLSTEHEGYIGLLSLPEDYAFNSISFLFPAREDP